MPGPTLVQGNNVDPVIGINERLIYPVSLYP